MTSHTAMRALDDVAKSICMPGETRVMRYPTYPATEMTGVFDYRLNETVSITADIPSSPTNVSGTNRFVLSRDVGGPYLRDVSLTGASASSMFYLTEHYYLQKVLGDSDYSFRRLCPDNVSNRQPIVAYDGKEWALVPTYLDGTTVRKAYNNFRVDAYQNGAVRPILGEFSIVVETYHTDGTINTTTVPSITAKTLGDDVVLIRVASITLLSSTYVAGDTLQLRLVLTAVAQTTFKTLQHPYDYGVNPEYANASAPFISCRCNSSALLLTNVTKVLNKEGTVLATRMVGTVNGDVTTPLFNFVSPATASATNPATRYFGALERGSYSFTAPDNESLNFVTPYNKIEDTIHTPGSLIQRTYAVLTPQNRYYNIIFLTDGEATTSQSSVAVNFDMHVEFRTRSTLFQLEYSRLPIEAYHAATLAVLKAGLFYENEWHKVLLNGVMKAARWAAPAIGQAYAGPTAGLVKAAADMVVNRLHQQKPTKAPPTVRPKKVSVRKSKKKVVVKRGSMKQKSMH